MEIVRINGNLSRLVPREQNVELSRTRISRMMGTYEMAVMNEIMDPEQARPNRIWSRSRERIDETENDVMKKVSMTRSRQSFLLSSDITEERWKSRELCQERKVRVTQNPGNGYECCLGQIRRNLV
jgi:hypothetical protein